MAHNAAIKHWEEFYERVSGAAGDIRDDLSVSSFRLPAKDKTRDERAILGQSWFFLPAARVCRGCVDHGNHQLIVYFGVSRLISGRPILGPCLN